MRSTFSAMRAPAAASQQEAVSHYRQAVAIMESISKEEGATRVLERADLKDMYRDAAKSYQGGA